MDHLARIEALEAEIERLRDQLDAARAALGAHIEPWFGLGLTAHESLAFGALYKRDMLTKDQLVHAIYASRTDDPPEIKIIDVLIYKIRKKIMPFGIQIQTVWGQGYRMDPLSKQKAASFVAERVNTEGPPS